MKKVEFWKRNLSFENKSRVLMVKVEWEKKSRVLKERDNVKCYDEVKWCSLMRCLLYIIKVVSR